MIEAEGEVEGGVAIPGAFGIEEDRAAGPIRMFFGLTSPCTSAPPVAAVRSASALSLARELGMPRAGGAEIGFEAERLEDRSRSGTSRRPPRRPAVAAWMAASLAPTVAAKSRSTRPAMQLGLPQPMLGRIEILHGEQHRRIVVRRGPRARSRHAVAGVSYQSRS